MGETGKHEQIVAKILSDLCRIQNCETLQITSAQLGGSKSADTISLVSGSPEIRAQDCYIYRRRFPVRVEQKQVNCSVSCSLAACWQSFSQSSCCSSCIIPFPLALGRKKVST
jgi:hypothetical protein